MAVIPGWQGWACELSTEMGVHGELGWRRKHRIQYEVVPLGFGCVHGDDTLGAAFGRVSSQSG